MEPLNPYDILGVAKTASNDEIKKAYRSLAQKHHPDHGGDEETFVLIKLAYETLSDPYKRRMYDQTGLFNGKRSARDEAIQEIKSMTGWILQRFDPERESLVERIHLEIDRSIEEFNNRINNIEKESSKIKKLSQKIKSKKLFNPIKTFLEEKAAALILETDNIKQRIKLFKSMKEIASEHYEEDGPP